MRIRRYERGDGAPLARVIARALRITNSADYSPEEIAALIERMTPEYLDQCAEYRHFYVAVEGDEVIGCGAIGEYWGSQTESSLFTIFVDPDRQKQGVGRAIIEALEADELFLRAERVEIPASITAQGFYRRMGYDYKDGVTEPDEEHLLRMEKRRPVK